MQRDQGADGPGEVPGPRAERRVTPDRRATGEQRRYNRRSPASEVTPPYYDVFERIAVALEGIEQQLADGAQDRIRSRGTER